jgi:hypothetical protein
MLQFILMYWYLAHLMSVATSQRYSATFGSVRLSSLATVYFLPFDILTDTMETVIGVQYNGGGMMLV